MKRFLIACVAVTALGLAAGKLFSDVFTEHLHQETKELQGRLNLRHAEANDVYGVVTDAGNLGFTSGLALGAGVMTASFVGAILSKRNRQEQSVVVSNDLILSELQGLRLEVEAIKFNQDLNSPIKIPVDSSVS